MDYTKRNATKTLKRLSNNKKKHNPGVVILKMMLLCIVGVAALVGAFCYQYASKLITQLPDPSTIDITPTGYLTTVYDSDGNEIEQLAASGANRTYVTLDEMPEYLPKAFVAIEDERFYEHNGIDLKGIVRAGVTFITSGGTRAEGASTITQQLLKNNYFTGWMSEGEDGNKLDSINRKIQEQYLAIEVSKIYSKDAVIENYLNTINLGQNTLGVEAAAERYFDKKASELTISECAVIASITQNPSKWNPISHPENNKQRRQKVLDNMLKHEFITESEYKTACADNVYARIEDINIAIGGGGSTSYFVDALTNQVIKDLKNRCNYDDAEAYQLLYAGGLSIYSTQDTAIQNIVEEEINNTENYNGLERYSFSYRLTVNKADGSQKNYSDTTMLYYYQAQNPDFDITFGTVEECEEQIEKYKADIMEPGDTIAEGNEILHITLQPQAAMTVMNQYNGQVVALVGGRGEKTASKTLNRATGITRQPGSTFKIIAGYVAALDAGGLTLASVQDDCPSNYSDGTALANYDNKYGGFTNIRAGITRSINVVAVKTISEIGVDLGYRYAHDNLHISTLIDGDRNEALSLGGVTRGVTNVELTAAYAAIANAGYYNKPIYYTQIRDHNGNVVLDNTVNTGEKAMEETTAWLITSAMQDVITAGTGTPAKFNGMHIAGKSGTTTKNRDTVFAGFTPYYTAVFWGGFDDNSVQKYTTYSKVIWKAVMSRIHSDLPDKDFYRPDDIVEVSVCKRSGLLPIEGVCDCDPRGSQIYTEYFAKGTEPTETCNRHWAGAICNDSHMPASSSCYNTSSGIWIINPGLNSDDAPYGVYSVDLQEIYAQIEENAAAEAEAGAQHAATEDDMNNNKKGPFIPNVKKTTEGTDVNSTYCTYHSGGMGTYDEYYNNWYEY